MVMMLSRDIREDYLVAKAIREFCKEHGKTKREADEAVKHIVKRIRDTYKIMEEHRNAWDVMSPEDWDRRYKKEVYDWVFTDEDKEGHKEENWEHFYNPYNDGRDCTGVWFTSYISIFPLPKAGKTIVYHFQSCDV